ncbi:alpha-hydroxy acid oxidase [Xanthobacter flavus]|uniref:alpha-hydroxy acid oxidase n=1 Tax=Xanthobacter flavus TaxID=281 RepID=UPI00372702AE
MVPTGRRHLSSLLTIDDMRAAARRTLPRMLFDFVDGGSGDESTLRRNTDGFADYALMAQALTGGETRDQGRTLFGRRISTPVLIAPTGSSGLLWPRGEAEVARAAAAEGTIMEVSAGATLAIEEVAAAAEGARWLQLFIYRDRGITRDFAARARAAGYEALVLTVDCPVLGRRERDIRNGFTIDPRLSLGTLADAALHAGWWMRMARTPRVTFRNFEPYGGGGVVDMARYISTLIDPAVSWKDVEWLRGIWDGPLIIKGILRAEDARHAVSLGCDGVQVSNHGGRQFDGTLGAIEALGEVVDAVAGEVPVLLDGGVRRGSDVLKAIALGACAVLIGRSHLWGLAIAGEAGVRHALALLKAEIDLAMAIGGWKSLDEINRDSIRRLVPLPAAV